MAAETNLHKKFRRYRRQWFWLSVARWFFLIAPFLAIILINRNTYFTLYNGVRMAIGLVIVLVIIIFVIMAEAKKRKLNLNAIWWWIIIASLCYLFEVIIPDLKVIAFCGLGGQVVSSIFGAFVPRRKKLMDACDAAIIQAEALGETVLNVKIQEEAEPVIEPEPAPKKRKHSGRV